MEPGDVERGVWNRVPKDEGYFRQDPVKVVEVLELGRLGDGVLLNHGVGGVCGGIREG